jgi:hypothetical protein
VQTPSLRQQPLNSSILTHLSLNCSNVSDHILHSGTLKLKFLLIDPRKLSPEHTPTQDDSKELVKPTVELARYQHQHSLLGPVERRRGARASNKALGGFLLHQTNIFSLGKPLFSVRGKIKRKQTHENMLQLIIFGGSYSLRQSEGESEYMYPGESTQSLRMYCCWTRLSSNVQSCSCLKAFENQLS